MANYEKSVIEGVVGFAGPNKFDPEQVVIKLEDNDTWFKQKKASVKFAMPNPGSKVKVTLLDKWIQAVEVLEGSSAPAQSSAPRGKAGGGFNSLGVELGHASNGAIAMLSASGKPFTWDDVIRETEVFYAAMKALREKYETGEVEEKPVKKASKPVKKETPVTEEFEEDDFPF